MGVCNVPVISTVCHVAGKAAATVISAPFDWIAQGVGNAAEWMFKGVWQLFDSTTLVDVTDPNYLKVYDVLFGVAVFLMLLFFCLQLITGLIRRDPGALQRAGIGLAKSVLGSFLVVTLTGLALTIVDELWDSGAQGVILGASELSLLVRPEDVEVPVLDVITAHVEAALELALA